MAYKLLSELNKESVNRGYEETVAASGDGDWIILDDIEPGKPFTLGLDIGTGSGSIEFTTRTPAAVKAGTGINEQVWSLGTISGSASVTAESHITAVRMVNASGTTTLTITP